MSATSRSRGGLLDGKKKEQTNKRNRFIFSFAGAEITCAKRVACDSFGSI